MRNARLLIGKSQEYVASRIGIERSTLTNYESEVSPVRWEIALRFCRQLIVSEEWLATGSTASVEDAVAASQYGLIKDLDKRRFNQIFMRQCVDLLSEPISLTLRPGMPFSTAFDEHLATRYRQLVAESFEVPRIVFTQIPETDLAEELIACMAERWLSLLTDQALRFEQNRWVLQRGFTRRLVEAADKVFWDFAGGPGAAYHAELSISSTNESASSVPLRATDASQKTKSKAVLDIAADSSDKTPMQTIKSLAGLRQKLTRLTVKRGTKAALARKFGVSRQAVDQWISGATSPSTEVAIEIMNLKTICP